MTDVRLGNAEPFCNVLSVHCFLVTEALDIFFEKGKTSHDELFSFVWKQRSPHFPLHTSFLQESSSYPPQHTKHQQKIRTK